MFSTIKNNFIYFLLAVICVTAFFGHETLMNDDWRATEYGERWKISKQEALNALENFKDAYKHTEEYKAYKEKADIRDRDFLPVNEFIEDSRFFGFKSKRQFAGEFLPYLGLFIYGLINLILVFIEKPKPFIGRSLLNVTILTIAIFYLRWCFNKENGVYADYLHIYYVVYNLVTVALIVISTYAFVRYKEKLYKKLRKTVEVFSRYAFFGVVKHLDKTKIEDHKKDLDNVLKEGMNYE